MSKQTTGLGQGVDLLFSSSEEETYQNIIECDISNIDANKHQPRNTFNQKELDELAQSIKEHGIIQPLIVRQKKNNGKYELVAGERRLKASQIAGLTKVPIIITEVEDENSLLELALIENIQRTDLNALEEAEAYEKLLSKFGLTQEETAKRLGKSRTVIANTIRLLKLPQYVKDDINEESLTEGHARTLLRLLDNPVHMRRVRDEIISKKLSVRETEKLVKKLLSSPRKTKEENTAINCYFSEIIEKLTAKFDSTISIKRKSETKGKIEIEYESLEDLERITEMALRE